MVAFAYEETGSMNKTAAVDAGRFRSRSTESTAGAMLPGIGRRLRWVGAMVPELGFDPSMVGMLTRMSPVPRLLPLPTLKPLL